MIKVGYVMCSTQTKGGDTLSFLMLLRELRKYGVEPYIVVPDRGGLYAMLQAEGIPTLAVNYRPQTYTYLKSFKDVLLFLPRMVARQVLHHRACRAVSQWFGENGVQIVHTNVSVVDVGFQAARRLHLPHVWHLREYGGRIGMHYFPCRRTLLRQLRNSYTISITRDICRYHELEGRDKARTIYNGVFPRRDALPETPREDFLLFAGRVEPIKSVDWMLKGYLHYVRQSQRPLPLKIAGSTAQADYYEKVLRYVTENGMENLVEFLGERTDLPELMQRARAIIIPSLFEGFGRCMAEAMFNGCLTIGRNTTGTKEQMDNGLELCGEEIALRFDTPEELALRLAEVEQHPDGFDSYIRCAFYTVNQLYSAEVSAENVLNLYNTMLKNR